MKNIDTNTTFEGNKLQLNPPENFSALQKDSEKNPDKYKCIFQSDEKQGDFAFALDENLLSHHLMFLGGIGTGKTTAICQAIAQFQKNLSSQDVMIIFDAKGDYYGKFYRQGIDVVISNDDKSIGIDGKKDYWNIFNEIEPDNRMEENIAEISKTLFNEKIEKTNQPFFPLAAKDLFYASLLYCCRGMEKGECSNYDIRRFWDSANISLIIDMLNYYPDLRGKKNYIGDGTSNQALGVLAELQELISDVFVGNFKKEGSLSIRQLVREKKGRIIFIEYDLGIGKTLTPIYSLLFDLAIKEALCRKEGTRGNVYFIADEFKLLPHLQHIDDAVNFGRSLGVKFLIGIQNVEQIYEAYNSGKGNERAKSLLSGFSTSICFRVNDKESREYIQGLHGKSRKKETFMSAIHARGISESIREAYVVEDWDISRLELGQAIIGLPGKEPFLFQFKKF